MNKSAVPNSILFLFRPMGLERALYDPSKGSFFKQRLDTPAPFALATLRHQASQGDVRFGNSAQFKISTSGDALWHMYACIRIPGIHGCIKGGYANPGADMADSSGSSLADGDCSADIDDLYPNASASACSAEDQIVFATNGGSSQSEAEYFASMQSCLLPNEDEYGVPLTPAEVAAVKANDPNFKFDFPSEDPAYVHWANSIGHVIVKNATLSFGNQIVDRLMSEFLFMWEDLSGLPGKRLNQMVGKCDSIDELIVQSKQERWLYVPLPFFFTRSPSRTLSLANLFSTSVVIEIEFAKKEQCIRKGNEFTVVQICGRSRALADSDIYCDIAASHVWFDDFERDRTQQASIDQVITNVGTIKHDINTQSFSLDLNLTQPVIEMMWAVRRNCHTVNNDWFNFNGVGRKDPIETVSMDLANSALIHETEASFYRLVYPYQFHSSIPSASIYNYSFAIAPEEAMVSGSINMNKFEKAKLNITMQKGFTDGGAATLFFFARMYNVFCYRSGAGFLTFQ